MLGVDFVINALLETSGFRLGGDCARGLFAGTTSKTQTRKGKTKDFTALILLRNEKCESAKALRAFFTIIGDSL
jgi:hypothetical protein